MGFLRSSFGATDTGKLRSHNEDSFALHDDLGLYLVADGVGGSAGGEQASALAVEVISDVVRDMVSGCQPLPVNDPGGMTASECLLAGALQTANTVIHEVGQKKPGLHGMCTTVVAMLLEDDRVILAHVGDSRIYRMRNDMLLQLTADHSLVQEQYEKGLISRDEMATSDQRHIVTRVLGALPDVAITLATHDVRAEDRYLLCSDGLTTMVGDTEILSILLNAESPKSACEQLISAANNAGGHDNITVVIAWVGADDPRQDN